MRQFTSARRFAAALLLTVPIVGGLTVQAQGLADPLLRFQTHSTEHFVIYFHQGEDALAARLSVIVEDVWQSMHGTELGAPTATTHVLLVDQSEIANGFATPIPRNIVFLGASRTRRRARSDRSSENRSAISGAIIRPLWSAQLLRPPHRVRRLG